MTALDTPCGCSRNCGDDGNVDGPGICKSLPRSPEPPLVEIVLMARGDACEICGASPTGRCDPPDGDGDCPHGCSPER